MPSAYAYSFIFRFHVVRWRMTWSSASLMIIESGRFVESLQMKQQVILIEHNERVCDSDPTVTFRQMSHLYGS